jgi:endogenous inhibitor of DNA gyrase (YacG/DUF329 family)
MEMVEDATCQVCGARLERHRTGSAPFCSRACRQVAYRARFQWKKESRAAGGCPTPYKQAFEDVEAAMASAREFHPDDQTLSGYVCRCGAAHYGHRDMRAKYQALAVTAVQPLTYVATGICEHCGQPFEKRLPTEPTDPVRFCTRQCQTNHGTKERKRRRAREKAQSST